MTSAAPPADHATRVSDALKALDDAAEAEGRLVHDAQRIAVEITHQRARTERLRAHLRLVLGEAGAAAGLT